MTRKLLPPLLHPRRAHNASGVQGEVVQQRRKRLLEREPHGGGVERRDLLDGAVVEAGERERAGVGIRVLGIQQPIVRELHGFGVEGRAVVKLHSLPERERVLQPVFGDRPGGRQTRFQREGLFFEPDQRVIDAGQHPHRVDVGQLSGIHRRGLGHQPYHQRLGGGPRLGRPRPHQQPADDEPDCHQHLPPRRALHLVPPPPQCVMRGSPQSGIKRLTEPIPC